MKVGYIQFDVKSDLEQNIKVINHYLNNSNIDLVVLPELCTYGSLFSTKEDLRKTSEHIPNGISTRAMAKLSKIHNCTIVFGLSEMSENLLYNSAVIVSKGKYIGKQQKLVRSDYETLFFLAGTETNVFTVDGVKIGIQICPDFRTSDITTQQVKKGAEIICILSSGGGVEAYNLAKERSRKEKVNIIFCNKVCIEKDSNLYGEYSGKSLVVDKMGRVLVESKTDSEMVMSCNIMIKSFKFFQNIEDRHIHWLQKYEIGIPEIDELHKKYVKCYNNFYASLLKCSNENTENWDILLSQILRDTVVFIQKSFVAEEELMDKMDYPKLRPHKNQHSEFTEAISKMLNQYKKVSLPVAYEFAAFIKDWILVHILFEDKQLKPFVEKYLEVEYRIAPIA